MHRLVALPGDGSEEEVTLIEQPKAPVLFLTSVNSDIATLASALALPEHKHWTGKIRALLLSSIEHPSQVDHYLSNTAQCSDLIIVRLLGGRAHWSYGLEQLQLWQQANSNRSIIILSGTKEHEIELHSISSTEIKTTERISNLLKIGGVRNMSKVLSICQNIISHQNFSLYDYEITKYNDPYVWDWKDEKGPKVGIILYRALFLSGDLSLANAIVKKFRALGLVPRTLWVSSLRDPYVKRNVCSIFQSEKIKAIVTTTSFSSVEHSNSYSEINMWDKLNIPVFQLLTSTKNKENWLNSKRGLSPLDLSMQIVLPELDGRITTRPCAFRTVKQSHSSLSTYIHSLDPEPENIEWVAKHVKNWIELQHKKPYKKKVSLVLANYPIRNGRIANGVGLDTPSSTIEILKWLKETGHDVGKSIIPENGNKLIKEILKKRTNNPETNHNNPLDYLSLNVYTKWWNKLPEKAKSPIVKRWGYPEDATDLEEKGFPIYGIEYGNISILIQPSRGYDQESLRDLHSPDLPPPHRYLAQYLWISNIHKSNAVVHIGKHGSLEWLPGKGIGLSNNCYPHIAIAHLPNIYPFIVNDPGEGSQAKRRSQAVIIDHLTPPLGLAGLHGDLLKIEDLMDEYYESTILSGERTSIIEEKIIKLLEMNNWPGLRKFDNIQTLNKNERLNLFDAVGSYICEIKESQIRIGLHVLGIKPHKKNLIELLFLIVKAPSGEYIGITQWIAQELGFEIDPWITDEGSLISKNDQLRIESLTNEKFYINGHLIAWFDSQAKYLLEFIVNPENSLSAKYLIKSIKQKIHKNDNHLFNHIINILWPNLCKSAYNEKTSFIKAISGTRVKSGPSGSPTRGRREVLPTGRNFYSLDLRGLPTEAAWDLGKRAANNLLDLYLMENGEHLKKLAISVWGTATMRNAGEEICQLFALIGVKPIWDGPTRRVVDIEVIPLSILGRPRVDVFLRISGLFRDSFPQLINYVNKAQMLVGSLNEPSEMNPLASSIKEGNQAGRVYGSAPGSYGAGLQAIIDSSLWESRSDLSDAYLSWSQWRYNSSDHVIKDKLGLENCLSDVQVVLHNQDNREHDILDSDDYYQFHGGLSAAVETISGRKPNILFGDHSRIERPRIHSLEKEIDKVMRSRMLNPRWIEGMKNHGYKGAFEMGASIDYLFAYDATTGVVNNWCYSEICDTWLRNDDTREFIYKNNPWVLRDISEKLLEAINRKMWNSASKTQIEFLKKIVIETEKNIEEEKY